MTARASRQSDRNHWLWVTGPDYYLDEDGSERADLDPGVEFEPGGWWTCHRDTEEGDLILLYRKSPQKDLAYLIMARSDAYSLLDDEAAEEQGWPYGCDFEVLEKFARPLTYAEMKADPALGDWSALNGRFQRSSWRVPADTWDHLMDRLGQDSKRLGTKMKKVAKRHTLERDIEDRLAADLRPFRRFGYQLELRERQFVCAYGGRADLVCFDKKGGRYVVIELKAGQAGRLAAGQLISYRSSMAVDFPSRRKAHGLLVGSRLDNEATGIIEHDDRLDFIALEDVYTD